MTTILALAGEAEGLVHCCCPETSTAPASPLIFSSSATRVSTKPLTLWTMEPEVESWARTPMTAGAEVVPAPTAVLKASLAARLVATLPPAATLSVVAVATTAPEASPGTPESKPMTGMDWLLALTRASWTASGWEAASAMASGCWLTAAASCSTCCETLDSASGPLVSRSTESLSAASLAPLKAAW